MSLTSSNEACPMPWGGFTLPLRPSGPTGLDSRLKPWASGPDLVTIYSEHALGILDEHDAGEHGTSSAGCPACTGWGDEQ